MLEHAESVLDTLCEVLTLVMKSTGTHVLGHKNTMRQPLWMWKGFERHRTNKVPYVTHRTAVLFLINIGFTAKWLKCCRSFHVVIKYVNN